MLYGGRFQRAELQRRGDAQTRAAEVKADAIARQRADDEASSKALWCAMVCMRH